MFQRAGGTLLNIINDILDLTKIESGQLDFERIDIDLVELLGDAVSIIRAAAARKGLTVSIHVAPDLETRLVGDPTRIRQILVNLLNNAVKFTDRGLVHLRACPSPGGKVGMAEIVVSDTGTGIPSDKLESIFDNFTQADSSTTRRFGGTGLGLSIARRLIERMGGAIKVKSEPGCGTTFTFSLKLEPRGEAPALPRVKPPPAILAGTTSSLHILVAEDSEDNQILMSAFLTKSPHRVSFANNGWEAVHAFLSHRFDLVIMDVQMPVMDGLEATRRIRELEAERGLSRIPILAMTASALAHDREATAAAGCDRHLTKPLTRERLLASLAEFTAPPDANTGPSTGSNEAPPIWPRIPEGLEELAATFLDSRRRELDVLRQLLSRSEYDEIRKRGHQLKGAGGGYGFPELTQIGATIEQAARQAQPAVILEQLGLIEDYLERVRLPA
jgi:CheY-like chemotaxis protein/HPt (histidine-containing phosphotransfer) domain-containing protein